MLAAKAQRTLVGLFGPSANLGSSPSSRSSSSSSSSSTCSSSSTSKPQTKPQSQTTPAKPKPKPKPKPGVKVGIVNTKVARMAYVGQIFPLGGLWYGLWVLSCILLLYRNFIGFWWVAVGDSARSFTW